MSNSVPSQRRKRTAGDWWPHHALGVHRRLMNPDATWTIEETLAWAERLAASAMAELERDLAKAGF